MSRVPIKPAFGIAKLSKATRSLAWELSDGYVLIDWACSGIPVLQKQDVVDQIAGGIITKLDYIKNKKDINKLTPEDIFDSYLLTKKQTLRFLRIPPEDINIDSLAYAEVGKTVPTEGPLESNLRSGLKHLLLTIRKSYTIDFLISKDGISPEFELISYILSSISDQAAIIIASYYENLPEKLIEILRSEVLKNDKLIRSKYWAVLINDFIDHEPDNYTLPGEKLYTLGPLANILNINSASIVLEETLPTLISNTALHLHKVARSKTDQNLE